MFQFIKNFLKAYKDAEILNELETLKNDFARLRSDVLLFQTEVSDTVLSKLERISKANEQRLKREKDKERNTELDNQEQQNINSRTSINGIPLYGGRSQWR